ncbi:retrovirus-related pol polyprotein from transposon TNT 1-94 [Tanacetum coccineum]
MHLLETARSLRVHDNFPIKFWGESILAATYLINKMPMEKLEWKSPFKVSFGKQPDFGHLKTIGCLCYEAVTKPHKDKFENREIKCILIGYPSKQKGYQVYNLETKEVFFNKDVIFKETLFPFKESVKASPMPYMSEFPSSYGFHQSNDDVPLAQSNHPMPSRKSSRVSARPEGFCHTKDYNWFCIFLFY